MSAYPDAESLLAIDVGNVYTRASFFSIVEGSYRLVATGKASSTVGPPLLDAREGVRLALDEVQHVTGLRLVDETETLIMPSGKDGTGVDAFTATISGGPEIRSVLVGLMPGVSLQSMERLVESTYAKVEAEIGLVDGRRDEEKIDLILSTQPDLVLIAGGTDGGAEAPMMHMVDLVRMALELMPEADRPHIVYAGNQQLAAAVTDRFTGSYSLSFSPNPRPLLGQENLAPARRHLAEVISRLRSARILGYGELDQWTGGGLMLNCDAFARAMRFLSQIYSPEKGVLGVDLGANQTTLVAAQRGELHTHVLSDVGMGVALSGLLKHMAIEDVMRWLPEETKPDVILDYIQNKQLFPWTIPVTEEEIHIEYALARQVLRLALARARRGWPLAMREGDPAIMPPIEPVLVSGGVLASAPSLNQTALVLLDALQPTGITSLVLDPHNLASALGAAADKVPMLTVQGMVSGSFVSLGTVVAPVGRGGRGRPVLRLRMEKADGEGVEGEILGGQLVVLPLAQGEQAKLILRPERAFDVGFGRPGKAGAVRVSGGVVGVIIDARGRPLRLPRAVGRCYELNRKWLWDIGALQ
jgi:hypothetical protein